MSSRNEIFFILFLLHAALSMWLQMCPRDSRKYLKYKKNSLTQFKLLGKVGMNFSLEISLSVESCRHHTIGLLLRLVAIKSVIKHLKEKFTTEKNLIGNFSKRHFLNLISLRAYFHSSTVITIISFMVEY